MYKNQVLHFGQNVEIKLVASGCDQCVGPVDMVTGCGQWWWIYFYLIMNIPTPIVSVLFGSLIPTFHAIFVNCFFILVLDLCTKVTIATHFMLCTNLCFLLFTLHNPWNAQVK